MNNITDSTAQRTRRRAAIRMWIAGVLMLAALIVVGCCPGCAKSPPC
ncbi:MAG: hypothetical protein IPK53_05450 [bacterium]|nr:hypothetical protein [bacterium]